MGKVQKVCEFKYHTPSSKPYRTGKIQFCNTSHLYGVIENWRQKVLTAWQQASLEFNQLLTHACI
jgi:hypothetical protein